MVEKSDELSLKKIVDEQIHEAARLKMSLIKQTDVIFEIAVKTASALACGNKVLLCGNGGSAADAQHIAAELAGKFYREREPLPSVALTTNTSVLTALANDYSYEEIFARQVRALAQTGDIVIGLSTGGNSTNVVLALEEAKRKGATAIAFTGMGGKIKDIADICLAVSSGDTPRIQEAHITAGHIICYLVEEMLFGGQNDH